MTLEELPFLAPNRSWRHKMFYIFRFLQCDMVLGIINPLSWIFHAISKEKNCLISMPFLTTYIDVRTINFFPPAESWLANLNFRAQAASKARSAKECAHVRFARDHISTWAKHSPRQRYLRLHASLRKDSLPVSVVYSTRQKILASTMVTISQNFVDLSLWRRYITPPSTLQHWATRQSSTV